mmetsp:Transcript_62763/g.198784  ORF Transcript_62763/g.198784 Transcript_62763/m.198784 type:complete len:223 (-) Transcript_62763:317-985(-)
MRRQMPCCCTCSPRDEAQGARPKPRFLEEALEEAVAAELLADHQGGKPEHCDAAVEHLRALGEGAEASLLGGTRHVGDEGRDGEGDHGGDDGEAPVGELRSHGLVVVHLGRSGGHEGKHGHAPVDELGARAARGPELGPSVGLGGSGAGSSGGHHGGVHGGLVAALGLLGADGEGAAGDGDGGAGDRRDAGAGEGRALGHGLGGAGEAGAGGGDVHGHGGHC